jgi:flagellar basal-body rod protein FlgB
LQALKLGLDAFALRGRVIADNVANATTPGFAARRVAFEEDLRDALARNEGLHAAESTPGHMPIGQLSLDEVRPHVIEAPEAPGEGGINNVVIEREMADLAQNELLYRYAAQRVAGVYRTMKAAIRGVSR